MLTHVIKYNFYVIIMIYTIKCAVVCYFSIIIGT